MPEKRYIWILNVFLITVIVVELALSLHFFLKIQSNITIPKSPVSLINNKLQIFSEKIPGSKFHGPDATWWGYNQSKIVRFGDFVFMYVMENFDSNIKTSSDLTLYKKRGDGVWERGTKFQTSTPGNILIDSKGILHVFVIEPKNAETSEIIGKLMHHYFPNAKSGDITNFTSEVILENTENPQTLNPRIGATIGQDDTLVLAFGMTKFNPLYKGQSEHIYYKNPKSPKWDHIYTDELLHDYYYPFVVATNDSFHLLTVQDDFTGVGNPNIYQQILYFEYSNNKWSKELFADHTASALAKDRPRMVEQDDLFVDSKRTIHAIYKENTYPENRFFTDHIHFSKKIGDQKWTRKKLNLLTSINWVRLFEVDGILYFFANSWDKHYLARLDSQKLVQLPINDAIGTYPYVSSTRTNKGSKFIDILLIAADSETFNKGTNTNYYVRIPKSELEKLK